jgi:hypothetical protein
MRVAHLRVVMCTSGMIVTIRHPQTASFRNRWRSVRYTLRKKFFCGFRGRVRLCGLFASLAKVTAIGAAGGIDGFGWCRPSAPDRVEKRAEGGPFRGTRGPAAGGGRSGAAGWARGSGGGRETAPGQPKPHLVCRQATAANGKVRPRPSEPFEVAQASAVPLAVRA